MGGQATRTFVRTYNADAMARVRAQLQGVSEAQLQKAAQRASVSFFRKVQPIAKRDIRARYGVASRALDGKFRTVEGRSRKGQTYIGVQASARRISLLQFRGKWRSVNRVGNAQRAQRSPGATAEVQLGQAKTYASAFIATVRGVRAIRVREFTTLGGPKRYGRAPLRMLRGPSPLEMLLGEDMRNAPKISGQLLGAYQSEIHRQVELLVQRKGGRA